MFSFSVFLSLWLRDPRGALNAQLPDPTGLYPPQGVLVRSPGRRWRFDLGVKEIDGFRRGSRKAEEA